MKHQIDFFEKEHIYLVDGVEKPSVTTVLNVISSMQYNYIDPGILEQARLRGSMVHEETQMIDLDFPSDQVPFEIVGYIKAYREFLRDYKPVWEGIEQTVYDEERGVCGTIDRYGTILNRKTVIDIKCKSSPTAINHVCDCSQTAEYASCLGWGQECDRLAVYLLKDGNYRVFNCKEFEKKRNFNGQALFDDCLNIYKTIERIKNDGRKRRSSI